MTIVSRLLFKQIMDRPALLGMGLIVAGVVVLQVFSDSVPR
jgi:small multidrug resistance pump